ncbi:MAG TPA: hypothetical protein VMS77_05645 [Conexivisphaerales archaeon]|nr:hypothetical protein [Conexivisphaerales archaeon]
MKSKALKLEEILENELKGEMKLELSKPFSAVEWDEALDTVFSTPITYEEFTKKTGDLQLIREVVDTFSKGDYDSVARSESRRKQLAAYTNTMQMYYNLVFRKGKKRVGYGALILFPKLKEKEPERSGGVILFSRLITEGKGRQEIEFERAAFDDFLLEVRPYVELLGELYRKSKKGL